MKPQDLLFLLSLLVIIVLRKPKLAVSAGLVCIALSMPLFAKWIFFTAQRLDYYGAGFLLVGIALFFVKISRKSKVL